MFVAVEELSPSANSIGLTKERLQFAVESRLRGARLYSEERRAPYLHVPVTIGGGGYSVAVTYNKRLFDPVSNQSGVASTWHASITGTHGGDPEFVVSTLSELLDEFLTEYLRVNDPACSP